MEIDNIINQESSDEEDLVIPGSEIKKIDDEPDGIIEDFHHECANGQENMDEDAFSSDDDTTLLEISQNLRKQGMLKVLDVPRVLYGKRKNNKYK